MPQSASDLRKNREAGTLTDLSDAVVAGGVSQKIADANTNRRYLLVQNISTEDLWLDFGGAAVADQPSIKLSPGHGLVWDTAFVPTQSVNLIGATTGSKFVAKEGN